MADNEGPAVSEGVGKTPRQSRNQKASEQVIPVQRLPCICAAERTRTPDLLIRREGQTPRHRLYQYDDEIARDGDRSARNTSRAQSACRWSYYPKWVPTSGSNSFPWVAAGNQCDEFPFASTYEGARVSWQENLPVDGINYRPRGVNYSVKPIPTGENGSWRGRTRGGIRYYYVYDRLLDGEEFFIRLYDKNGKRINP
ncbi:NucA/NucB deoxyribonuclease domain-containing protein [Streptosporangium carneum]|uniref:NucA/NucB deoxyribonuclease domain-containing protein n=1 Tax=Streptosporangium carneum TaxID=47481 RepID=UPI0034D9605B